MIHIATIIKRGKRGASARCEFLSERKINGRRERTKRLANPRERSGRSAILKRRGNISLMRRNMNKDVNKKKDSLRRNNGEERRIFPRNTREKATRRAAGPK